MDRMNRVGSRDRTHGADRFERDLARMMRNGELDTPFETRHRERLHAGVRARQRVRAVWLATGSVLTAAGLGVALLFLASAFAQGGSPGPSPRPVTSAESAPNRVSPTGRKPEPATRPKVEPELKRQPATKPPAPSSTPRTAPWQG